MTRPQLSCVHEPFGDAWYFGPERLSSRYESDPQAREASGFSDTTYKDIFNALEKEQKDSGKRLFIKDMAQYFIPLDGKPASIAPSLGGAPAPCDQAGKYPYDTAPEPGNPTVVPAEILQNFHFTFLIRHPSRSIPSYYRCTIPPLAEQTGFANFDPSEAGYAELRALFEFLKAKRQIGPLVASQYEGNPHALDSVPITVVDADDLLDNPNGIIKAFCAEVGLEFDPAMLSWSSPEDKERATKQFEKWRGFHEDAIHSDSLKPRDPAKKKKPQSREEEDKEWTEKYGEEGAKVIRETVDANVADYEYLKQYAVKVPFVEPNSKGDLKETR
jgi:hypothetical protein